MTAQDRFRQLDTLVQIASLLTSLDVDKVLTQMIYLTSEAVSASKGSFILLDEHQRTIKRYLTARDMTPQAQQIALAKVLSGGVAGWVVKHRQAALIADTENDDRWLVLDDGKRVRSAVVVPFFIGEQMRGVITLEHPEPGHFTSDDLRLVEATASQASASLQNAELFDRIQQQQRQLEAVLNSISDALLVVDRELNISMMNPSATMLFGEIESVTAAAEQDGVSNSVLDQIIMHIREQGDAGSLNFEVRSSNGQHDYTVSATKLDMVGERGGGYVIALHEITSLKDLSRLKTHMLKMASHDLKNPLNVLIGYLDLINSDAQMGLVPDTMFIDNMHRVITKMLTMIASLLDSQRQDDTGMQRIAIDPYELVSEVLEELEPLFNRKAQTLNVNIAPNLRPLRGEPLQIREAVANLIGNANKYTPEGGTITVDARGEDERFYFSVTDTGYGIPQQLQSRIFQPYFRAVSEATKEIEGTGVGLSLVKETIERHGGQVSFFSEEGMGSTFTFWLPVF